MELNTETDENEDPDHGGEIKKIIKGGIEARIAFITLVMLSMHLIIVMIITGYGNLEVYSLAHPFFRFVVLALLVYGSYSGRTIARVLLSVLLVVGIVYGLSTLKGAFSGSVVDGINLTTIYLFYGYAVYLLNFDNDFWAFFSSKRDETGKPQNYTG